MSTSFVSRIGNWLWQGRAVADSRTRIAAKSRRQLDWEQYARTTAEVADRALHPVTPLRSGPGEAVAALLYVESIRASLRSLDENEELAVDESTKHDLASRVSKGVELEWVLEMIAEPSEGRESARESPSNETEAEALGQVAHALIEIARQPERQEQRALTRRILRVGSTLTVLLALLVAAAALVSTLMTGPDLAEGKPWRASSVYGGFSPETGMCDGRRTEIFFHTNRENEPWVELDLGAVTTVRRVKIQNRRDCCRDRAYPLAVEGSIDGQRWQELARRSEPFSKWEASFAPTDVRFVRVKALKHTYLHLESVEIR